MVGIERLRTVGLELYGDTDPTTKLSNPQPLRVEDAEDGDVALVVTVPFAEKGDVEVMRRDDELFLTVGPYRRSLVLPDSLKRRNVKSAKLDDGELSVVFTLEET